VLRGAVAAALLMAAAPAFAQYDFNEQPILASGISDQDIVMRARWVRQWREEDGTLVLMLNGGFRLDFGQRRLSSNNAVVWIEPSEDDTGRKYYALTVYLAENAEIREPGRTWRSRRCTSRPCGTGWPSKRARSSRRPRNPK
jgi:hypothetical protein